MPLTDTSPEAQEVQVKILRAMSGEQRMSIAFEMSIFARELAAARIRQNHPDWKEQQVNRELLRIPFLPEPLPAHF